MTTPAEAFADDGCAVGPATSADGAAGVAEAIAPSGDCSDAGTKDGRDPVNAKDGAPTGREREEETAERGTMAVGSVPERPAGADSTRAASAGIADPAKKTAATRARSTLILMKVNELQIPQRCLTALF